MSDRDTELDARTAAEARDWLDRVCAHDATAQDEAAMQRWRALSPGHADVLADAMQLRGRMLAARDALRADPAMQELLSVPAPNETRRAAPGWSRRALLGGAVAASAAAVMAVKPPMDLWPSLAEWRSDYRTGIGERRTVQVAEGLAVELNTRTAVARANDSGAYRLALISGEVAVDARHPARPAVISTEAGEARADAGQFGVRLLPRGACITCLAGAVAVTERGQPALRLVRGQQVTIGTGGPAGVVPVDPNTADAWRRGELIFADRPLREVVDEVNRYRSGRIILTDSRLGAIVVNAVFRLDSIDRAVSQIRVVSQASVTELPGGIVLLS